MSSSILHSLPIETIDAIAAHITKPYDVLNFGLTCKSVFVLVITRHLRYRVVGPINMTGIHDLETWRDLAAHPDRTANIYSLNLEFATYGVGSSPEAMLAVDFMQNLSEITLWDKLAMKSKDSSQAHTSVWESLSRKTSLKSLRVILDPGCNIFRSLDAPKVTNLTTLEVSALQRKRETENHINSILFYWIQNNPYLQTLSLFLPKYVVDITALQNLSLPYLRSFSIETKTTNGEGVEIFFRNHQNLLELNWNLMGPGMVTYPLGNIKLRYLEKLSGSSKGVLDILRANIPAQNNIRCVKNLHFGETADVLDVMNIRMLDIERLRNVSNVCKFTYLEWLRVDGEETLWDADVGYHRRLSAAEWAAIFYHLPYLQVFRGVSFLGNPALRDDVDDRVAQLCRLAPRLNFVDHWEEPAFAIRFTRKVDVVEWDVVSSAFADNSVNWHASDTDSSLTTSTGSSSVERWEDILGTIE